MPFIKLLLPLMAGICMQWYSQCSPVTWLLIFALGLIAAISFFFLSLADRYRLAAVHGLFIILVFIAAGALLAWKRDIRNDKSWFNYSVQSNSYYVAVINENPVEKNKSFKANAVIGCIINDEQEIKTKGNIILYFSKDSFPAQLSAGSRIVFYKPLQEIKNPGNPGSFDYKRYCLFQQITHQVYLRQGDYVLLETGKGSVLAKLINSIRKKVLFLLETYIPGEKEKGLAEALLIGYKDDLDKTLVQSYSNTGVVHIIAISGLHLGLIYWLLLQLLKPLKQRNYIKWLQPVLVIAGLWLFSLLAGAQPSVLRSAVMFTCIVLGESIGRKSSVYNSLAASAFILLCYNPYWLWDVGFQLSYAAVLSIVIFMQPVYNWFYVKNKILDFIWKLNAVTIAAQVLTVPISIYHFHQFPNYFLLTNFIAVPLSSLIVLGEIFLCFISFIPFIASLTGKLLHGMIWWMNTWVERIEALPFSLWDGLYISIVQMIFLITAICLLCHWLLEKNKPGLVAGLIALLLFTGLRAASFLQAQKQEKIIVYNVPQQKAIDIIEGRNYRFIGDASLANDDFARNFHLKPSRILYRTYHAGPDTIARDEGYGYIHAGKHVLFLDSSVHFSGNGQKQLIDLLVLSKNPKLYIKELAENFSIQQVVFDGSVPACKSRYWKKDCDSLNIPNYDVAEKGAFVMNLR